MGEPDAQWGPLRDIPCIVLDPGSLAKLHIISVCGAELWMGTAQVNTEVREGDLGEKGETAPAEEAEPPLRPLTHPKTGSVHRGALASAGKSG